MNLSEKKKSRSFVSFILNKQNDSNLDENIKSSDIDLSEQNRKPTLIDSHGQSILPQQWPTNSYGYFHLIDELLNKNQSCFGFSLTSVTSKYCLYMSIIMFLGICLIISLTAILKN